MQDVTLEQVEVLLHYVRLRDELRAHKISNSMKQMQSRMLSPYSDRVLKGESFCWMLPLLTGRDIVRVAIEMTPTLHDACSTCVSNHSIRPSAMQR